MFRITPDGPFDLARSIGFLEGWPAAHHPAGQQALRFAFCPDDTWQPVAVSIATSGTDLEVSVAGSVDGLRQQLERILSLDVDTSELAALVERDPVVKALVDRAPGLRPVTFWTPWEAACWAVLSQRTSMASASGVKARIAEELGTTITLDGGDLTAFPSPAAVLAADRLPAVNPVKLERIRGLAEAAESGLLTAAHLRSLPAEEARAELLNLPGVGPFSASLILIRGAGAPDVFTTSEPRILQALRTAYNLAEDATDADYEAVAANWTPFRSWVAFWLRATPLE